MYDIRKYTWVALPGISELLEEFGPEIEKIQEQIVNSNFKPSLNRMHEQGLIKISELLKNKRYLFPQFISMMPGKATHKFSNITVTNLDAPFIGVLQFIRDAFFGIGERSQKDIFN